MVAESFQDVLALTIAHGVGLHLLFLQITGIMEGTDMKSRLHQYPLARYDNETYYS